jgi:hypothetical protein
VKKPVVLSLKRENQGERNTEMKARDSQKNAKGFSSDFKETIAR